MRFDRRTRLVAIYLLIHLFICTYLFNLFIYLVLFRDVWMEICWFQTPVDACQCDCLGGSTTRFLFKGSLECGPPKRMVYVGL